MSIKKISVLLLFTLLLASFSYSTVYAADGYVYLEPESITTPYLESEETSSSIVINLKVSDVVDLKEFHITFDYNESILEYVDGDIDSIFYHSSRGWTGGDLNGILADTFTGSGTMFSYTFRAIGVGSTEVKLAMSEFIDVDGESIAYDSLVNVTVLGLSEYVDGLNRELQDDYDSLLEDYNALEGDYTSLTEEYEQITEEKDELEDQLSTLTTDYETLESDVELLLESYELQENQISELESQIEELENQGIPGFPVVALLLGAVFVVLRMSKQRIYS